MSKSINSILVPPCLLALQSWSCLGMAIYQIAILFVSLTKCPDHIHACFHNLEVWETKQISCPNYASITPGTLLMWK
jgi:hypothetical protein